MIDEYFALTSDIPRLHVTNTYRYPVLAFAVAYVRFPPRPLELSVIFFPPWPRLTPLGTCKRTMVDIFLYELASLSGTDVTVYQDTANAGHQSTAHPEATHPGTQTLPATSVKHLRGNRSQLERWTHSKYSVLLIVK